MAFKSTPEQLYQRFFIYFIAFQASVSLFNPFAANGSMIQKPETDPLICSANRLFIFCVMGTLVVNVLKTVREKCPNTEFFLVCIFLYSDRIHSRYGKIQVRKTPCLDTFHALKDFCNSGVKKGVKRKQSTPNFLKNKHFLPPDMHTHVCVSRGKKCLFFRTFGGLCFLVTPVLTFSFLPY